MSRIGALTTCALAALSAISIAGCSSSTAAVNPTPEQTSIVVDSVPAAEEAGLYVAQYEGYFKKQGLNVIIKPVTGGEAAIPDLQSGAAQFVAGNYVSFILAQINKTFNGKPADFRIVAAGSEITPGTEALYVRKNSPFQTVGDLAIHHATVGLNTTNDVGQVLFGALYQDNGYSFFKDAKQVTPAQGFPALLQMLKAGQVDAAWLPEPFGTIAEQTYGAEELADFDSGATENFPFTGYIGTAQWVKAHPRTVAAFLKALTKGQETADTQRAIAEKAMAHYTGLARKVADSMAFDSYPLTMDIPQLQRVPDEMFQFGLTDGRATPFQIVSMIAPEPGEVR
ncbi:MAG TPA: ABC transporter substrate-binding protein [Trebonia sp.]|nr:ABC transporter substrate-binding protein [Trebonia sp.]